MKNLIPTIIFFFAINFANAQCTISTINYAEANGNSYDFSTFMSGINCNLASVTVDNIHQQTYNLGVDFGLTGADLFTIESIDACITAAFFTLPTGSFDYTYNIYVNGVLSGSQVATISAPGAQNVILSTPISVSGTDVITLETVVIGDGVSLFFFCTGVEYPQISNLIAPICSAPAPGTDIKDFGLGDVKVGINGTCSFAFAPSPIPTLSEWGLICLSLIMIIFGIVGIRQNNLSFGQ